jgi:membrane-bound ClpP family serine protease
MVFLTNPNLAQILASIGIILIFLANFKSKTLFLKIGIGLCFIAAVLGYLYLEINPWTFLIVALSPFLFTFAFRQKSPQNHLLTLSNFMLALGLFLLLNQPLTSNRWAWVSILSAIIIWISTGGLRNIEQD